MSAEKTRQQEQDRPLGVALIGYAFMGKAHSNAWRNVASFFDVPAFEQKVLVGRDAPRKGADGVVALLVRELGGPERNPVTLFHDAARFLRRQGAPSSGLRLCERPRHH